MNPMNNGVAYADITELDGAIMAHLLAVLTSESFADTSYVATYVV